MAPPDVPEERTAALRQAFAEMLKDPQFIADAKAREIDPDWLAGPDLQQMVAENFATPQALVDKVRTITTPPR